MPLHQSVQCGGILGLAASASECNKLTFMNVLFKIFLIHGVSCFWGYTWTLGWREEWQFPSAQSCKHPSQTMCDAQTSRFALAFILSHAQRFKPARWATVLNMVVLIWEQWEHTGGLNHGGRKAFAFANLLCGCLSITDPREVV